MRKSNLLKAVAVAVLPMLVLSACGSTSDTNADAKTGEQTVTFWYSNSGPAVDAINQLVSEFNDAHKGKIKVEASYQGSYSDVQQKFSAAVQAKSTPSILQMNDTSTGYMIDSKMTTPVYKFAEGDSDFDTADLQPVALKYYSDDNGLLSLPFAISQPVTYINNKLAEEAGLDVSNPPTTFDEVVEWANTIHEKTGAYGFSMNMVDSWILEMLSASSGELIATPDNGRGGKDVTGVNMTSKTQLDMFQKIVDMFKDGTALNPGTDSSSMMTAFTSDKLGLVLTSSASYTSLLPGGSTSNVTVAQFPHDASNKKAGTPIGGNSLWIVAAEQSEAEQKATCEFGKYMMTPHAQAVFAKASGNLFANTKAVDETEGKEALADPNVQVFYDQLAANPSTSVSLGARTGAYPSIRKDVMASFNEVVSGSKDLKTAMQEAQTQSAKDIATYNKAAGK